MHLMFICVSRGTAPSLWRGYAGPLSLLSNSYGTLRHIGGVPEEHAVLEIPSPAPDDPSETLVDQVMAVAHLPPAASVVVIGHHTLPFLLALMHRGCACVRSLRPDVASPDGEAADLAWIVDVANENELCEALQAARADAPAPTAA